MGNPPPLVFFENCGEAFTVDFVGSTINPRFSFILFYDLAF
jgi:hypothetical protein